MFHRIPQGKTMKKSLIALAVLAASGAAMAQSSVTVYGRVDLSVGSLKELDKGSMTKLFNGGDGGLTTSRLGFRGSEDLGGGLKANFKLEHRLNADDGTSQDPFWKGESTVSLAGGFGEIKLGRSATVYDEVRGVAYSSNVFDSAFTPAANGVWGSGGDYSSRFNNKITYALPNLGGVYGAIEYALDEDAAADANMIGAKVGYKAGPLDVVLGLQKEKGKENDYMLIAAAYDLGVLSLSGGYNTRSGNAKNGDDKELTLGVNVPLGSAVNLSVGYANSKTDAAGKTTAKSSGFGVGATYAMSKRTKLYGGLRSHNIKNGVGTKTADTRLFAIGLRHDF
jgi:predicted porin